MRRQPPVSARGGARGIYAFPATHASAAWSRSQRTADGLSLLSPHGCATEYNGTYIYLGGRKICDLGRWLAEDETVVGSLQETALSRLGASMFRADKQEWGPNPYNLFLTEVKTAPGWR